MGNVLTGVSTRKHDDLTSLESLVQKNARSWVFGMLRYGDPLLASRRSRVCASAWILFDRFV